MPWGSCRAVDPHPYTSFIPYTSFRPCYVLCRACAVTALCRACRCGHVGHRRPLNVSSSEGAQKGRGSGSSSGGRGAGSSSSCSKAQPQGVVRPAPCEVQGERVHDGCDCACVHVDGRGRDHKVGAAAAAGGPQPHQERWATGTFLHAPAMLFATVALLCHALCYSKILLSGVICRLLCFGLLCRTMLCCAMLRCVVQATCVCTRAWVTSTLNFTATWSRARVRTSWACVRWGTTPTPSSTGASRTS